MSQFAEIRCPILRAAAVAEARRLLADESVLAAWNFLEEVASYLMRLESGWMGSPAVKWADAALAELGR